MNKNNEVKKTKKQFWLAFGLFMGIILLLVLGYLILSILIFFG